MESSSVGAASAEIYRSYGACGFVGGRFYKDAAPTALGNDAGLFFAASRFRALDELKTQTVKEEEALV